jgi:hypothetical protein
MLFFAELWTRQLDDGTVLQQPDGEVLFVLCFGSLTVVVRMCEVYAYVCCVEDEENRESGGMKANDQGAGSPRRDHGRSIYRAGSTRGFLWVDLVMSTDRVQVG